MGLCGWVCLVVGGAWLGVGSWAVWVDFKRCCYCCEYVIVLPSVLDLFGFCYRFGVFLVVVINCLRVVVGCIAG